MANKNWNSHAGCCDFDFWVQNFLGFGHHFPLFFGVTAVEENIDMWDHIEGDLLGEYARWFVVHGVVDGFGLIPELIDTVFAGAGYRLIGADHNTFDPGAVVQGFQGDNHLRSRAIWIGDDVFLAVTKNGICVYFGHNQRHIRIVTIQA